MTQGIGSASPLEIGWTAVTALGTLNMLYLLWQAWLDERYIRRNHLNGARKLVARMSLRGEALHTLILLLFTIIGALAMATPPTARHEDPSALGILLTASFIAIAILTNADSLLRLRERKRVVELESHDHKMSE